MLTSLLADYGIYIALAIGALVIYRKGFSLNSLTNLFKKNPDEGAEDVDLSDGLDGQDLLALAAMLKEALAKKKTEDEALQDLVKDIQDLKNPVK